MWLQGAFGRSDGRSCRRQNISWTGSSSGLPEPGPRLSESSAAGMNRVSQRCTCSGLFFYSDFCKPAFMTVCLLWAWLSTRRQSHDKQLYGWDLLTVQTAYSWFLFFINNWNIDSMKDEWSRRYKCDAQTATPHSNQITRWRLVITFPPHTLISCQSWQETAAHLWGLCSFTHSNTDINLQTQQPPIISWQASVHTCAGVGQSDSLVRLMLRKMSLSCCSSTNSSVPELWSRFLQVSWSFWWSHESKTDFLWNSSQLWQSHRGHMTEPTWECWP